MSCCIKFSALFVERERSAVYRQVMAGKGFAIDVSRYASGKVKSSPRSAAQAGGSDVRDARLLNAEWVSVVAIVHFV